jgi:hypothetical protein
MQIFDAIFVLEKNLDMKPFKSLFLLLIIFMFCNANCKKKDMLTEDPRNHSLLKKSLLEIKSEIAGTWKLSCGTVCTFAGCNKTCEPSSTADIISFLSNDTVKQTSNNGQLIYLYDKATITKQFSYTYNEDVYMFSLQGGYRLWTMQEIKNDTLIITEGNNDMYLTR